MPSDRTVDEIETPSVRTENATRLIGGWHCKSATEVLACLESSEAGISSEVASQRLEQFGTNRLKEQGRTSALMRLLLQFHNPLIYVLLVTAGATGLLQHWVDTGVILGVVVINAIIGFIQESKAEQAIESLKQMLAPVASVMRDGKKTSIAASEIVPGDIVYLQSGDKVPADLRLLRLKNMQIDEATLTGESVPATKSIDVLPQDAGLADQNNLAFAGTLVTTGTAVGVVVATGDNTQIGRIAGMLRGVQGVDTPLIRRLAYFSKVITIAIVVFCILVFVLGIAAGHPALDMMMATVALAVSAIPEGLPAIMTITLAIGVKRMAARNAVIRKLPAVEALGSTTVICTDKTGTLTRNEMTVTSVVCGDGVFSVTGGGYLPQGDVLDENDKSVSMSQSSTLEELLTAGVLCNDSGLHQEAGQWKIDGDPTEGSLLVLAGKAGLVLDSLLKTWPRTDEIPFESESQFMATLHHNHLGEAIVYLKGAPEAVLSRCTKQWNADAECSYAHWQSVATSMAEKGLRVLAIAEKSHDPQQTVLDVTDTDHGFSWLGLVGMLDPSRQEAIEAVAKCHAAGIQVKMITGDHVATARAIGRQVGIGDGHRAISGTELDQLDDAAFDRAVVECEIFARVSPAHKLKLVQALQRQGHVVAMTGDGVNDAPALKQADIGIAMGQTGTEVSKEAAEMVLLDDNFASIERAVEEGRTVYNNLRKTILFILPTNGGECLTLVAALLLGTLLPILPLHILWINLVTTVALAVTLAFDPVDADIMSQKPRDPREPLLDRGLVWRIVYVSIVMALGTFALFFYELRLGSGLDTARGVAVNAIVFFEVAYLFNSRHLTNSIINRRGLLGNHVVWWGVAAVVIMQVLFTYWPVANRLFEIGPLSAAMWLRIAAAAIALLLLVETEKAISRRIRST